MKSNIILFFVFFLVISQVQGKTKNFGTWIEFEVSKDIYKNLKFSFKPEVRLQDDFSVDEYFVEGQLSYKPIKYLRFAGAYRLSNNIKNSGNVTFHRFAFDAHFKNEWNRLKGALRVRYTNYAEFELEDEKSNYIRYRAKFGYDVKNSRLQPFISYELFNNLTEKDTNKGRFDIGTSFKISDKSGVGIYYRLQSYFADNNSINILGISYNLSLD